jgi:hypothetical protein
VARDAGLVQALGAGRAQCGDRIQGEDQSDEPWGLIDLRAKARE